MANCPQPSAIRILHECERDVVFTLGRYTGTNGPRLILLVAVLQQMARVDQHTQVLDVPDQDVISHDNVSVCVSAVIFRVVLSAHGRVPVATNGCFAEAKPVRGRSARRAALEKRARPFGSTRRKAAHWSPRRPCATRPVVRVTARRWAMQGT
jgi:regulator of protease activity HflC (stomatin/prohibitin superfamily)